MRRLLFFLITNFFRLHMVKLVQGESEKAGEDYEYQYDDDAESKVDIEKGGARLVGASKGDATRLTFLVGYKIDSAKSHHSTCTGTLISPQWIISAAHCITDLVDTKDLRKCAQVTRNGGAFTYKRNKVKCTYFARGNIKIDIVSPEGVAYLGVADINKFEERVAGEKTKIDFIVRHAQSYQAGGSYGKYGGYDISLVHLAEPAAPLYAPACLPGPNQQDTSIGAGYNQKEQANLAGFGKYARDPCMTDQFGPSKFHYCDNPNGCSDSPVPKMDPECTKFFANPDTPDQVPVDDEDLLVLKKVKGRLKVIYCHHQTSPAPDSKGWCRVTKDVSDIVVGDFKTNSWGFCGKDCYMEVKPGEAHSILRKVKNIDILDEKLCETFLNSSLTQKVEVYPRILCVGYVKQLKYSVWLKEGERYREVPHNMVPNLHKMQFQKGLDIYVHSAGTCSGDSGGPVFSMNDEDGTFTVLGAVSGGRGALGHCGGLNNPTHYARISFFRDWIELILGDEIQDVCYGDGSRSITYQQYKNLN